MSSSSHLAIAVASPLEVPSLFHISPDIRSLHFEKDGAILLNVVTGKYFSLNGVGALIWERVSTGEVLPDPAGVAQSLSGYFDVSLERLNADVLRFFDGLVERGILVSGEGRATASGEKSRKGELRPEDFKSTDASSTGSRAVPIATSPVANKPLPANVIKSCMAFGLLVAADIALRFGGFRQLYSFVRAFPVKSRTPKYDLIPVLCGSVDRATRWYLKPAWCLQRSVVLACVLRRYGMDGRLVIGCHKFPFSAHAWVEVDGIVVNDHPNISSDYGVIDSV